MGEKGSAAMKQFADAEADANKVVSVITQIEARSSIARLLREKRLTPLEALSTVQIFTMDIVWMTEQPVTAHVIQTAKTIIDMHSLRTLDAVQLASAIVARTRLSAPDMRFIGSDINLLAAAMAEGFDVWDPAI